MEQARRASLWGPAYGPEHQNGGELLDDIHDLYLTPDNLLDYSSIFQLLDLPDLPDLLDLPDLPDFPRPCLHDPSDNIDILTYGPSGFPDRSQQDGCIVNHESGEWFLGNYEYRSSWEAGNLSYLSSQEPSVSSEVNCSSSTTEYDCYNSNNFTPTAWGALSSFDSSFSSEPRTDVEDNISLSSRPYSLTFDDISVTSQQSLRQRREYSILSSGRPHARKLLASSSTSDHVKAQPKSEKPLHCDKCDIKFRHRRNLERHKSTIHADDAVSRNICHYVSCDGKGFARKDKLIEHLRRHHGEWIPSRFSSSQGPNRSGQKLPSSIPDSPSQSKPEPTPFLCKFKDCIRHKRGFRTLSDLQRHQRDVHDVPSGNEPDKGYRCTSKNCPTPDKIWSRLDNLRNHIRNLHGDEDIQDLIRGSEVSKFDLFADKESLPDTPFVFSRYHIKMSKER